jgi:AcrR family transcriptional regulator
MTSPRRPYRSHARADQARATRRRILDAALQLFVAQGYTGTTLAAVAEAASVSPQTLYNAVGGKAALLAAVYDVTLAGDDEPVPLAERPAILAVLAAPDGPSCVARYAAVSRELGERLAPLLVAILAEAGNPEVAELAARAEEQRAIGAAGVVGHLSERFGLRPGVTVDEGRDVLWALTAPEVPLRLVARRGWSWDRYEAWLADTLAHALLGAPPAEAPR